MLTFCLFVCLLVCRLTRVHKNAVFSQKQLKSSGFRWLCMGFSKTHYSTLRVTVNDSKSPRRVTRSKPVWNRPRWNLCQRRGLTRGVHERPNKCCCTAAEETQLHSGDWVLCRPTCCLNFISEDELCTQMSDINVSYCRNRHSRPYERCMHNEERRPYITNRYATVIRCLVDKSI